MLASQKLLCGCIRAGDSLMLWQLLRDFVMPEFTKAPQRKPRYLQKTTFACITVHFNALYMNLLIFVYFFHAKINMFHANMNVNLFAFCNCNRFECQKSQRSAL